MLRGGGAFDGFLEFSVYVPAVPDSHKNDQEHLIPNLVHDAVISHPDSVQILFAGEGLYAMRAGISG